MCKFFSKLHRMYLKFTLDFSVHIFDQSNTFGKKKKIMNETWGHSVFLGSVHITVNSRPYKNRRKSRNTLGAPCSHFCFGGNMIYTVLPVCCHIFDDKKTMEIKLSPPVRTVFST